MNKGLKIAIGVATIGVVGVAGYFIYKAIKARRDANNGDEGNVVTPPANVEGGNENSNAKTPFTNKAQGDLFRQWVNKYYPNYAKDIDLSVSGDIDNSFMRKAWGKYGETYKKGNPNFLKVKGNAIPENLLKAFALRKDKGALGNNSEGAIFLRTITLGQLDNKDVYAYFYSNGKVSFVRDSKRVRFDKWWDLAKQINADKNFKGTDFYNTAYQVYQSMVEGAKTLQTLQSGVGIMPTFPFNGNLKADLDAQPRGLDLDTNIID